MKLLIITLVFISISGLYAQQPMVLSNNYEIFLKEDHLGQTYKIEGQSLIKEDRGEIRVYQNPFLGNLSHLDIRNPLELVLFFDESNQMIVLDNQLSEKFTLNFTSYFPEIDPIYVGSATKNFYWVVDDFTKQIYYLDLGNKKIQLISNPIQYKKHLMYSDANWFYWIDDQKVNQLNKYGVSKEYVLKHLHQNIISFTGNYFIFERDGVKYSYDIINEKEILLNGLNEGDRDLNK